MFITLKLLPQPDIAVRHAGLPEAREHATAFGRFLEPPTPDEPPPDEGLGADAEGAEAEDMPHPAMTVSPARARVDGSAPAQDTPGDAMPPRVSRPDQRPPDDREPVSEAEPRSGASGPLALAPAAREPGLRAQSDGAGHRSDAGHGSAMQRDNLQSATATDAGRPERSGHPLPTEGEVRRPAHEVSSAAPSVDMRAAKHLAHEPLARPVGETLPGHTLRPETDAPRAPPDAEKPADPGLDAQIAARTSVSEGSDSGPRSRQSLWRDADHRGSAVPPLQARTTLAAALPEEGLRHISLAELAVRGRASGERPAHPGRPPSPVSRLEQHAPLPRMPVETMITQALDHAQDLAPDTLSRASEPPSLTLATQSDPAGPAPVLTRPQNLMPAPPGLAAQLAEAMRHPDQQVIRIQLAPEELGRVRITLQQGEAGMHLLIQCDRPETQELMRRNAFELARDLAEMGFEGLSLDFGNRKGHAQPFPPERLFGPDAVLPPEHATEAVPASHARGRSGSGLDVRL